ncbi:MAG: hypothetical protein IJQ88_08765 [Clostridia bacterium]|nr:hypothetical protein [Clostridia bacterium]MBQ6722241.1 hypothetical protein [Clostridia bacterium]
MNCTACGKALGRDETGLSRKLISRAARDCYCLDCLGKRFHVSRAQLQEMAEHFRRAGCTLFT